jgi:hypothetical protein
MCTALAVFKIVSSVPLITHTTTAVCSNLDCLWFSGSGSSFKQLTSHMHYQRTERQCTLWALFWALCFATVAEISDWRRSVWDLSLSVWLLLILQCPVLCQHEFGAYVPVFGDICFFHLHGRGVIHTLTIQPFAGLLFPIGFLTNIYPNRLFLLLFLFVSNLYQPSSLKR